MNTRMVATLFVIGVIAASISAPLDIHAQSSAVEPDATRILKRMTDHMVSLEQFSLDVHNMYDDVLISGQKIQHDLYSSILIHRPDKLRSEIKSDLLEQFIVYNGKTLTIFNSSVNYYAVAVAPDNIDDMLYFAHDELDIVPPSGDLVFTDSYDLLTANITSGVVVGKSIIDGVSCDHLAFTSPIVDWQIWIADGDTPLPYKYTLNTNDDPSLPQYIVLMSNWNITSNINDELFEFTPPKDAVETDFIRMRNRR